MTISKLAVAATVAVVATAIYKPEALPSIDTVVKAAAGAALGAVSGAVGGLIASLVMYERADVKDKPAMSFLGFATVPAGAAIGAVAGGIIGAMR